MARQGKEPVKRDAQLSLQEINDSIRKIDQRISELEGFDVNSVDDRSDPRIGALSTKLREFLVSVFGSDSTQYDSYRHITLLDTASINMLYSTPIHEVREGLVHGIKRAIVTLQAIKEGFEEHLDDARETETGRTIRAYEGLDLHPEINKHVSKLYLDGHYAEAVEKSVKVLNGLVRLASGEELDGNALMEKVFSPGNPILRFNDLSDESEKNEQKGFMFLFSGAVTGLRNPRAHRLMQDSPERALEFIAFISLLAKLVDQTVSK